VVKHTDASHYLKEYDIQMRRIYAPAMCDQIAAWSGTTDVGTPEIRVECVVDNVLLEVTLRDDASWTTVKNAEAALSVMVRRLEY
jgi:hypothetical protein